MKRRIAIEQLLGWTGFILSSFFILALASAPIR